MQQIFLRGCPVGGCSPMPRAQTSLRCGGGGHFLIFHAALTQDFPKKSNAESQLFGAILAVGLTFDPGGNRKLVRNLTSLLPMSNVPAEAQALFNEANEVFVDEDYDTALELYSKVPLPQAPESAIQNFRVSKSFGTGC